MTTLRYVTATFILPYNRILLSRQRLNERSVTQWRASTEYVLAGCEVSRQRLIDKVWLEYGLDLGVTNEVYYPRFSLTQLDQIHLGQGARVIFPFVIKIKDKWNFKSSRVFEFHTMGFEELLDDVYHHSVYHPGIIAGEEKHTYNTVQILSEIHKRGIIKGG